jgi:hypothetical protein
MDFLRSNGRKTAGTLILTIFSVLVSCMLLGCGSGQRANQKTAGQQTATAPPSSSPPAGSPPAAIAHSVQLSWAPSTAPGVLGYNVYRGIQSGGPYVRLNPAMLADPDYRDTTVASGQTYFYAVTTASSIMESGRSAEVIAVIPTP